MGKGWRMEDNDDAEEHREVKKNNKKIPVFHRSTNQLANDAEKQRSIQGLNLEAGVSIPNSDEIERRMKQSAVTDRKEETKRMRKFSESYSPEGKPKAAETKLKNTAKTFQPGGSSFIEKSESLKLK